MDKPDYDLMGHAQTGSGKTGAYPFPIIDKLVREGVSGKGSFAIVVSPTRELAQQLGDIVRTYVRSTPLRVVTTYGKTCVGDVIREIGRGTDILVSTPGCLMQFVREEHLKLEALRFLVLDEAHKLL